MVFKSFRNDNKYFPYKENTKFVNQCNFKSTIQITQNMESIQKRKTTGNAVP